MQLNKKSAVFKKHVEQLKQNTIYNLNSLYKTIIFLNSI